MVPLEKALKKNLSFSAISSAFSSERRQLQETRGKRSFKASRNGTYFSRKNPAFYPKNPRCISTAEGSRY